MPLQTNAYKSFKAEAERLTNLVVLFSHSVPVLARVLGDSAAAGVVPIKPADNFPHDRADGPLLLQWAKDYDQDLARLIVLSVFSYFEAYIRGALIEMYELQGGQNSFIKIAERRAARHWALPTGSVAEAKRRLQARDHKGKTDRFKKFSKILDEAGFAFPPDLLSVYGAQQLAEKLGLKSKSSFRAYEIPDLLSYAILCPPTAAERKMFEDIRGLRNKVAHGTTPVITVHAAIKKSTALRKWAARVDAHLGEHFLVLAKYSK